jgi:hypothetical protein
MLNFTIYYSLIVIGVSSYYLSSFYSSLSYIGALFKKVEILGYLPRSFGYKLLIIVSFFYGEGYLGTSLGIVFAFI